MNRELRTCAASVLGFVLPVVAAIGAAQSPVAPPVLPGPIGTLHHPIETASSEAQRLFDAGLTLFYGFNREGARRSFTAAAARDPAAAMPHVGVALSFGPNLNTGVTPEEVRQGCAAARKGATLARQQGERAYAEALVVRYCDSLTPESSTGYAIEMGALFQQRPDDPDAAALYADSLLSLRPRTDEQNTELVAVLELALRRWPDHVGANHYYIHVLEGSRTPERALASAKRLETLVPAIGHLLHMPAHIYSRTGEYGRAIESNVRAAAADLAYLKANPGDEEQWMSYEHGVESLAVACGFAGRFGQARDAADATGRHAHGATGSPATGAFSHVRLFVLLRFHRWKEVLQTPAPPPRDPSRLWYHFARAAAYAQLKDMKSAAVERAAFAREAKAVPSDAVYRSNRAATVLSVFQAMIDARVATALRDWPAALQAWERAVAAQERLVYHEPPPVYYPVRESLGAALFERGRFQDAARVFREDLARNPRNGRSLFGLWQSLVALSRDQEAEAARRAFQQAWAMSDTELSLTQY